MPRDLLPINRHKSEGNNHRGNKPPSLAERKRKGRKVKGQTLVVTQRINNSQIVNLSSVDFERIRKKKMYDICTKIIANKLPWNNNKRFIIFLPFSFFPLFVLADSNHRTSHPFSVLFVGRETEGSDKANVSTDRYFFFFFLPSLPEYISKYSSEY